MRQLSIFCVLFLATGAASSQVTFNNMDDYCTAASEASTPTLLARTQGVSRAEVEAYMNGMTDPVAIRMVKESIAFAYARPAASTLTSLRSELKSLCLARKIFAQ